MSARKLKAVPIHAPRSQPSTEPAAPDTVAIDLVKLRTGQLYSEAVSTQSVLKCVCDLIFEGFDGGEAGGAEVAEVVRMAIEKLDDICDTLGRGLTEAPTDEERQELEGVQS